MELRGCSLGYDLREETVAVAGIDVQVKPGELVVLLGKFGSGKSTALHGVLGEVALSEGSLGMSGAAAFCSQQPWIFNDTLRGNILFGQPFEEEWYCSVLQACSLAADLKQLPQGDRTEIGERGVTLSGGQKQRVALARAVYRNTPLVLLDDVFSALDAHTARRVLHALLAPGGLLRQKAVLLASHSAACAELADKVILLGCL